MNFSNEVTTLHALAYPILFTEGLTNGKYLLKNKNQLDVTYYCIVLLIGSTCFGTTMPIIRSSRL